MTTVAVQPIITIINIYSTDYVPGTFVSDCHVLTHSLWYWLMTWMALEIKVSWYLYLSNSSIIVLLLSSISVSLILSLSHTQLPLLSLSFSLQPEICLNEDWSLRSVCSLAVRVGLSLKRCFCPCPCVCSAQVPQCPVTFSLLSVSRIMHRCSTDRPSQAASPINVQLDRKTAIANGWK